MNADSPASVPKALLDFFKDRSSYPHQPANVEHIQTHISHVFIAANYVYKIKKPLNLEFLDFSSLEKRKYYCRQEIELNRRLCTDLYLDVVPVYKENGRYFLESDSEASSEPVEFAVKMRRLDKKYFLSEMIEEGLLNMEHLDRVASKLADFYDNQQPDEKILEWGSPDKIRFNTDENFRQTRPFIGHTIEALTWKTIRRFSDRFLDRCAPLFKKRIKEKRIVDGHGDLHLEHIHITPGRVCIYDCIEFNERFRYQDLAADLAYLSMDLDFRDLRAQSRYFVREMSGRLEDRDLLKVLNFYKCYRAYIRGKVKSIESEEEEISESDRRQARELAARYFRLSLCYALLGSGPVVLVFMGRVASGKSTLAEQLSNNPGMEYYSSDIIRKKIAGLPLNERTPSPEREELYASEMSIRTYDKLSELAVEAAGQGSNVILDATFSSRTQREALVADLDALDVNCIFIEADAPAAIRKKRLVKRDQEESISDARLEDFEMLEQRYNPPEEIDPPQLIRLDTSGSTKETLTELYTALVDRQLDQTCGA